MSTALSIDSRSFLGMPPAIGASDWHYTAVSGEARQVAEDTREIDCTIEHSEALFGTKAEAISELWSVADECSEENWDGEGALHIESLAARNAERFIRMLPEDVPMPEITPEPDGSVGLDWSVAPSRVIAVSFGSSLRLAYAWLDGTNRGHAVARFNGETIPREILDRIREVTLGL